MNSLRLVAGLLGLSGLLGGCANPVARNYVPAGSAGVALLATPAENVIRETQDLAQEAANLQAQGWTEIGRSSFTDSGKLNFAQAETQAKKIGAALVLWKGWAAEEKFDEVVVEPPGRQTVVEVPAQPGVSPNPVRQVSSPSSSPYKVTVYHYEVVFWRKPAG